eukprot:CFRG6594T1
MCGIGLLIGRRDHKYLQNEMDVMFGPLAKRGPSSQNVVKRSLPNDRIAMFCGCVLHIRGELTPQPATDSTGQNLLLWNGEVFGGKATPPITENDTAHLMSLLESNTNIETTIRTVQGPFSFVYLDSQAQKLWIGRDCFGRRSLLIRKTVGDDGSPVLYVTSTSATATDINGVNPTYSGVQTHEHSLTPNPKDERKDNYFIVYVTLHHSSFERSTWESMAVHPTSAFNLTLPTPRELVSVTVPNEQVLSEWHTKATEEAPRFIAHMSEAIRRRVISVPSDQPNVMILFSGGVDSMIMAFLSDRHIPKDSSIDLVNVAFENPRIKTSSASPYDVPDRITGRQGYEELVRVRPDRKWVFVEVDVSIDELEASQPHIRSLIHPLQTVIDLSIGSAMWHATKAHGHAGNVPYTPQARVVLVGVGADEQLGGYSRHRTRFETDPRNNAHKQPSHSQIRSREDEFTSTSMSRNPGTQQTPEERSLTPMQFESGKNATEAFQLISPGWKRMLQEMKMDVDRIWTRNLGRDDRIISDLGREARFPFLDEDFVSYLSAVPIWIKTDPRFPRGIGEKLLLRIALKQLGLHVSAAEPKRAIQFGTRVARNKQGIRREKGSDLL